jgi:hypothetical protein
MFDSIGSIGVFFHNTEASSWERNNESTIAESIKLGTKRESGI